MCKCKDNPVLTERQLEIAILIAEGYSNKEISKKLHIAEQTVRNTVSHGVEPLGILQKLNIKKDREILKALYNSKYIDKCEVARIIYDSTKSEIGTAKIENIT